MKIAIIGFTLVVVIVVSLGSVLAYLSQDPTDRVSCSRKAVHPEQASECPR